MRVTVKLFINCDNERIVGVKVVKLEVKSKARVRRCNPSSEEQGQFNRLEGQEKWTNTASLNGKCLFVNKPCNERLVCGTRPARQGILCVFAT